MAAIINNTIIIIIIIITITIIPFVCFTYTTTSCFTKSKIIQYIITCMYRVVNIFDLYTNIYRSEAYTVNKKKIKNKEKK